MPGTSSHTKICLNSKGLKRVNSHGQGNHYVNLKIIIPTSLSREQKALIEVIFALLKPKCFRQISFEYNLLHRPSLSSRITHPVRLWELHGKPSVSQLNQNTRRQLLTTKLANQMNRFPKNSLKKPKTMTATHPPI